MPSYSPCPVGASIVAVAAVVIELVPLGPAAGLSAAGIADLEHDVPGPRRADDDGQRVAGGRAQVGGQVAGDGQLGSGPASRRDHDAGGRAEREVAAADGRRYRLRHDVEDRCRTGGRWRSAPPRPGRASAKTTAGMLMATAMDAASQPPRRASRAGRWSFQFTLPCLSCPRVELPRDPK